MITLYQFPPAWGLSNLSHFCLKVETYLRMVGLPYRVEIANPRKAPKGKLPYIDDEGTIVTDSETILDHLEQRSDHPLDDGLTPEEQARGIVLRRAAEEHTYFGLVWLRWAEDETWAHVREVFRPFLDQRPLSGPLILGIARRRLLDQIRSQGIGRHTGDVIVERVKADLTAFSTLLADQPFFLGDLPRTVDATLYGMLAETLANPWDGPEKVHLQSLPNLVAFCERMRTRYWADWEPDA